MSGILARAGQGCDDAAMDRSGIAAAVGAGAYAVIFTSERTRGDDGYAQSDPHPASTQ